MSDPDIAIKYMMKNLHYYIYSGANRIERIDNIYTVDAIFPLFSSEISPSRWTNHIAMDF